MKRIFQNSIQTKFTPKFRFRIQEILEYYTFPHEIPEEAMKKIIEILEEAFNEEN